MLNNELIINNLLSEVSSKIEWKDNETYLQWLKTEIGMDDENIKSLMEKGYLHLPYPNDNV